MPKLPAILLALVLLIGAGLVHGFWSERWQKSEVLERAMSRVALVPLEFGEWQAKEQAVDPDEFRRAGAEAYWMRTYTHRRQPVSILVILMCGRAGRMSVHTPQVCYQGAGFNMVSTATPAEISWDEKQPPAKLWTAKFDKERAVASDLQLFWGWNAFGTWEAPEVPRWRFQGQPYLYKLYVSRLLAGASDDPSHDPARNFLKEFLPQLQETLFELDALAKKDTLPR